jgi:hypothetical protein
MFRWYCRWPNYGFARLNVSRGLISGLGGSYQGPYFPQHNFTDGVINYVSTALDHHGRAIELLPWPASFDFPWNVSEYTSGQTIEYPISKVKHERLDGCLLNDTSLCSQDLPHTHKTSVQLSSPRFGLWSAKDWSIKFEDYYLRMNSTSLSAQDSSNKWYYGFNFAPGAACIPSCSVPHNYSMFGKADTELFNFRENVITDSWFVNNQSEKDWPCYPFPQSLRSLNSDVIAVVTIYPSRYPVSQVPNDILFLSNALVGSSLNLVPQQIGHILCWKKAPLITIQGRTVSQIDDLRQMLKDNSLPEGLHSLLSIAWGEFLVNPARFLRSSTLLQSVSGVPAGKCNPLTSPPVPFGAEMHPWAHVGALDILSKPTRFLPVVIGEEQHLMNRHFGDHIHKNRKIYVMLFVWSSLGISHSRFGLLYYCLCL